MHVKFSKMADLDQLEVTPIRYTVLKNPTLRINQEVDRTSGQPTPEILPFEISAKTREMGLLYGENFIILTSTVFVWFTRVTDRWTDGGKGDSI